MVVLHKAPLRGRLGALVGVLGEDGQIGAVVDRVHPAAARHALLNGAAEAVVSVLKAPRVEEGLRKRNRSGPTGGAQLCYALGLNHAAQAPEVVVDVVCLGPIVDGGRVAAKLHPLKDDAVAAVLVFTGVVAVFVAGLRDKERAGRVSLGGGGCPRAGIDRPSADLAGDIHMVAHPNSAPRAGLPGGTRCTLL